MEKPLISTVILNWNRCHLLKVTVESYLATISVPYELFVVDNASTDGSREYLEGLGASTPRLRAIFRKKNVGGEALNSGLRRAKGRFLHTSENDIEYLPGWDRDALAKFETFPELGQLSFFGPEPERARGEVWERTESIPTERNGVTIYLTDFITSTCIWRREIWDLGFRWSTVPFTKGQSFRFPSDFAASDFVRQNGYWVAWNDKYTVINWGHNVEEWQKNVDYYLGNYQAKPWLGLEGLRGRLQQQGYDLVQIDERYTIVRRERPADVEAGAKGIGE